MESVLSLINRNMTDIGFKRMVNKDHKLMNGYERKFMKCSACGHRSYYDYVPYSLSAPVLIPSCGHRFREDFKPF